MNFPSNIEEVLDQELLVPNCDLYQADEIIYQEIQGDCLLKIMEVGLSCAADSPDQRITTRDALHKLKSVRDALSLM